MNCDKCTIVIENPSNKARCWLDKHLCESCSEKLYKILDQYDEEKLITEFIEDKIKL
jgi:hypothetical protein